MDPMQARAEWVRTALEQHGAALIRYAASITGDSDTARDVVQDTFLRLCRESPERLDGHLAEWLFTVCRNRALDMQRQSRRLAPLEEHTRNAPAETPLEPGPAAAAEQNDTLDLALSLLKTLPPRQQEVIRLKFQAGLSYLEISQVTRLSVSNVGFILHTALKTLRARLQRAL
jgi:RNA polymerase sigma-70 factor (ECF subfamily)